MSSASSVEPQGSTQLLHWVVKELAILAFIVWIGDFKT